MDPSSIVVGNVNVSSSNSSMKENDNIPQNILNFANEHVYEENNVEIFENNVKQKLLQNEIGMAVLFITHDMAVVAEVADRVIVMKNGKIVEQGDVDTIFHNPDHPYTKKLINAVPQIGSMKGKDFPEMFPESEIVEILSYSLGRLEWISNTAEKVRNLEQ